MNSQTTTTNRQNNKFLKIFRNLSIAIAIPPAIVAICTGYNMTIGRHTGNIILPLPTSQMMGKEYMDTIRFDYQAMYAKNPERYNAYLADAAPYRYNQINNVRVKSQWYSGANNHVYELTKIDFDGDRNDGNGVKPGSLTILTDSNIQRGRSFWNNLPFRTTIPCADRCPPRIGN
jgi:hypothetical protein